MMLGIAALSLRATSKNFHFQAGGGREGPISEPAFDLTVLDSMWATVNNLELYMIWH